MYCASSMEAVAAAHMTAGYFTSDCQPCLPDPLAQDDNIAARLWDLSASQTGLPAELRLPVKQ